MLKNSSKFEDGWFSEICPMWEGAALSLQVDKVLHSETSRFQKIDVYQTKTHGKMLVLDGVIQLTERDEFSYQEMMAHLPLFAHPNPEHVLVIGGGDGGVLREVEKHACVRSIDFCEIDEQVIAVSRKFLPGLALGFDDPRVTIHIEDGNAFAAGRHQAYDVIIVDSSDPIGPGEALFERPFYENIKQALKPGGIVASQGESFFLHARWAKKLIDVSRQLFPVSGFANVLVPTYPGGHIGVCLGSLGPQVDVPSRPVPGDIQDKLRYYSFQVHKAAFVLPHFARDIMGETNDR